jgi:hypothetical protein
VRCHHIILQTKIQTSSFQERAMHRSENGTAEQILFTTIVQAQPRSTGQRLTRISTVKAKLSIRVRDEKTALHHHDNSQSALLASDDNTAATLITGHPTPAATIILHFIVLASAELTNRQSRQLPKDPATLGAPRQKNNFL